MEITAENIHDILTSVRDEIKTKKKQLDDLLLVESYYTKRIYYDRGGVPRLVLMSDRIPVKFKREVPTFTKYQIRAQRARDTWNAKTPEQKAAIIEKRRETMRRNRAAKLGQDDSSVVVPGEGPH